MKFTPPEWMPRLEWEAFVLMRKKMRHPLTDRACELITRKLANYRTQGYAPGELLDSAVEHGWLSVYVPNGNGRTTPVKATSVGKGRGSETGTSAGGSGEPSRLDARIYALPQAGCRRLLRLNGAAHPRVL